MQMNCWRESADPGAGAYTVSGRCTFRDVTRMKRLPSVDRVHITRTGADWSGDRRGKP